MIAITSLLFLAVLGGLAEFERELIRATIGDLAGVKIRAAVLGETGGTLSLEELDRLCVLPRV